MVCNAGRKLSESVIDEKNLDQQRRSAKDGHEGADRPDQKAMLALLRERQQQCQCEAEQQGSAASWRVSGTPEKSCGRICKKKRTSIIDANRSHREVRVSCEANGAMRPWR